MPRRRELDRHRPRLPRNEFRCGHCDRLLATGTLEAGDIELVCHRCGTRCTLRALRPNFAPPQSGNDGLLGDRHACIQKPQP